MQYNLSNNLDKEKFKARIALLMERGNVVDLTEKVFRTPNQNRYLHLLIGVVAMDTGNSLEDAKVCYFKRLVNPSLFVRRKMDNHGNDIEVIRSTRDLTQEEMSIAIDRFKRWGYENGIYMPSPEDTAILKEIEIEMGRMKMYV